MDIGRALGFVFEDEKWVNKLLLGAAVSLVPVFGGIAVTGYAIAVLRNVRAGEKRPLPAWDELGRYLTDGLMFWVAILIYSIPFLVLACPMALVWIPPAVGAENQDLTVILASIAGVVTAALSCVTILYAILLWLLAPVLRIRYAEASNLASCLRFGEVFRFLFRNIGPVLIAQALVWLVGLAVTSILGTVIGALAVVPICGWVVAAVLGLVALPASVWLMVVAGHLYGQIGRRSDAGTPVLEPS
ncbi:MAG: DUF4013 domain-containing protein [Anaerolineae bacterium]|jgi:hypothetical protein